MEIKVLGAGCAKCGMLEKVTRDAVAKLGLDANVEHVSDWARIAGFGVMTTPALVVDGAVKLAGRIPSADEVEAILSKSTLPPAGACDCGGNCC